MSPDPEVISVQGPLADGESRTFSYRDSCGLLTEGMVFRHNGHLYAYRNQCRHQPLTLDYGDGNFFTDDQQFLLCRNHGALFQPETGLCVSGPCTGACLFALDVSCIDTLINITIPPTAELELE